MQWSFRLPDPLIGPGRLIIPPVLGRIMDDQFKIRLRHHLRDGDIIDHGAGSDYFYIRFVVQVIHHQP